MMGSSSMILMVIMSPAVVNDTPTSLEDADSIRSSVTSGKGSLVGLNGKHCCSPTVALDPKKRATFMGLKSEPTA